MKQNEIKIDSIVEIVKIDHNLDGIAKIGDNILKVPFATKGDQLKIKEINYNKAIPIVSRFEIIAKNSSTKEVICEYYTKCGGCKGQHLEEEEYLAIKKSYLVNGLNKIIRNNQQRSYIKSLEEAIEKIEFIHHLDNPCGHRRRAFFAIKDNIIGFRKYRSNNIVDIKSCPLLRKKMNATLMLIRDLNDKYYRDLQLVELAISEVEGFIDVVFTSKKEIDFNIREILATIFDTQEIARIFWQKQGNKEILPVIIKNEIYLNFGVYKVKYGANSFLQAESFGEGAIKCKIIPKAIQYGNILDLFCGLGGYTLEIASRNKDAKITALEIVLESVNAINQAKGSNNKVQAKIRDIFSEPLVTKELSKYDFVIINPPRIGARKQAIELQKSTKTKAVAMVYCSVSGLLRDLEVILQEDIFVIDFITIIDQFVFSEHMEILVMLSKK